MRSKTPNAGMARHRFVFVLHFFGIVRILLVGDDVPMYACRQFDNVSFVASSSWCVISLSLPIYTRCHASAADIDGSRCPSFALCLCPIAAPNALLPVSPDYSVQRRTSPLPGCGVLFLLVICIFPRPRCSVASPPLAHIVDVRGTPPLPALIAAACVISSSACSVLSSALWLGRVVPKHALKTILFLQRNPVSSHFFEEICSKSRIVVTKWDEFDY